MSSGVEQVSLATPDVLAIEPQDIQAFLNAYPLALKPRYFSECLEYRARHDGLRRGLLRTVANFSSTPPDLHDYIDSLLLTKNLLLPKDPERLEHMFDFIGSVVAYQEDGGETAVAIVENPLYSKTGASLGHHEGGVGKTSLTLALLGIPDFLDRLPPLSIDQMSSSEDFEPILLTLKETEEEFCIISLDFTYAALFEGKLIVAPILGVMGDSQWDIARRATRVMAARSGYGYDRQLPEVSKYQRCCAEKVVVDKRLFVPEDALVPMERMVVVNFITDPQTGEQQKIELQSQDSSLVSMVELAGSSWVALQILGSDKARDLSRAMFLSNPIYHSSLFWFIDEAHHRNTIAAIESYLLDQVALVYVYPGGNGFTSESAQSLFQAEAALIRDWIKRG